MAIGTGPATPPRGVADKLRHIWARARELWPLTRLGAFVLLLGALGLRYLGIARLDLVWYIATICAFALVALAVLLVAISALYVRQVLNRAAEQPLDAATRVTQLPFESGFRATRLRFWPLVATSVEWREPVPASLTLVPRGPELVERVALQDHGELRHVDRRIRVADVLGLASLTLRHRLPVHWDVLPHKGALRKVPWLASLAGGDDVPHPMGIEAGDRLELRRYAPGDPARFIHWKAYARTRRLVVRVPERALSRTHRTAAYLVAGPRDGASAAAALAALDAGAFGADWVFGADGSGGLLTTPSEVEAAVRRSASARREGGRGLAGFLEQASRQGPVALMLFVPAERGEWCEPVLAALRSYQLRPVVVVGVDGFERPRSAPFWQRLLWIEQGPQEPAPDVRGLVAELRAAGADVRVADRQSGRMFAEAQWQAGPLSAEAA